MEMTGEQLIPASQDETWAALNDPQILKGCVPGCESMERVSDTEYSVQMTARVGPVSAKFKGRMTVSNLKPPVSYSIAFEGQGGVAGFARGGADVSLAPHDGATRLAYKVKANVGGKLAQIGSRLVDAAAHKVAGDFFSAFNRKMAELHGHGAGAAHGAHPAATHDDHQPPPVPRDPDLPQISDLSLSFFAAGALVVFVVALVVLL